MEKQHIYLRGVGADLGDRLWEAERLLRIGRLQQLEVVLNESSVSRRHAELAWTEQGWVVRDLGSVNGTFLNGERVGRGDHPVRRGDVIQCGNVHLLVDSLHGGTGGDEEVDGRRVEVLGSLKQSREEALGRVARAAREKLLALFHVGRDFRHTPSLDACLEWVLCEAAEALGAQAGCIALWDEGAEQLALRAAFAEEGDGGRQAWFSGRLSQRVLTRGESLLCRTIADDTAGRRSLVCVLLRSLHRQLGVLCLER
ncbi:MAG TPA: FHA domain-containing protein, partial [Gemmataceae bacterium]|nr:FHA domain-containing protein [Gemmataceae bacterium]